MLMVSTPPVCQHLLDMVQRWVEWSHLQAKVPNLGIRVSTGKTLDPGLSSAGESIPSVDDSSFKFLGMPVNDNTTAKFSLKENLQRILEVVDQAPVTRQQKFSLFKQGICPRLSWPLLVEEVSITWLKRDLQPVETKYLMWAGLARSSNTEVLVLPSKWGGLALPSVVNMYKKHQSLVCLFTSGDPGVRHVAQGHLHMEQKKQRVKFKSAVLVDSIRAQHPSKRRQGVAGMAKRLLVEEEAEERHEQLCRLPTQGAMARKAGRQCLRAVGDGCAETPFRGHEVCPQCLT